MEAKSLPKFLISLRTWLLLILSFLLAASVAFNIYLNVIKTKIAYKASVFITYDIGIKNIFFVFPNNFLLSDITLTPKDTSAQSSTLATSLVTLQMSIWDILWERRLAISTILLDKPQGTSDAWQKFLNDNANYLIALLQELPRADVHLVIKKAHLDPAKGIEPATVPLVVNFDFLLRGENFLGKGAVYSSADPEPLQLNFNGALTSHGLLLNQCTLTSQKTYANFWGDLNSGNIQLKGHAFLNSRSQKQPASFLEKLILRSANPKTSPAAEPSIDIIDIDAKGRMRFPKLQVDRLNFNLNGFPVTAKADILLASPPSWEMTTSLDNAPAGTNRIKNFKQANLNLSGSIANGTVQAQGKLNFLFEKTKEANFPLEKIEMTVPKISFSYDRYRRLAMQFADGQIAISTIKNRYQISFAELTALLNMRPDKLKIIDLTAALYGGNLQGRIWCDVARFPIRITGNATLSDLEANTLAELLVYFSKIHGNLDGKLQVKSHPGFALTGDVLINDGRLENFDFFKWMAETFHIPSLTNVAFATTAAQFWLNAQGNGLTDIEINSLDVGLTGYFNVDKNNLVASKLSLSLSRAVLQESPKFNAILRMFEEDVPSLIFDFQLSGNQEAMNFQWLQSEFKQHIEDRIPNFVERMIDRKINAVLEGKTEEAQQPAPQQP